MVMNMYGHEYTKEVSLDYGMASVSVDMPTTHAHECHELYYLESGHRRYLIGSNIYDVSPGNIVLIPTHCLHRTTACGSKGHSRYVAYFSESYLQDFVDTIGQESFDRLMQRGCLLLPDEQKQYIASLLRKMEQESASNISYNRAALKLYMQEILLCLIRYGSPCGESLSGNAAKIQEVAHYICENYGDDITLAVAANMACMEKTYFSRSFKEITGFGFREYLTRIRLLSAKQLLQDTTLSISEISSRCGFSSSNYFGDVFLRYMHMSPREYRKNL